MTEKNTEIMRDAFRLLAEFETVPDGEDETYWRRLVTACNNMHNRWNGDKLAFHMANGVLSTLQDKYNAAMKHEQQRMAI